jgi:hypothetical protein
MERQRSTWGEHSVVHVGKTTTQRGSQDLERGSISVVGIWQRAPVCRAAVLTASIHLNRPGRSAQTQFERPAAGAKVLMQIANDSQSEERRSASEAGMLVSSEQMRAAQKNSQMVGRIGAN